MPIGRSGLDIRPLLHFYRMAITSYQPEKFRMPADWNHYLLYLLPVIGALIGWLTNLIAVKMLFHPRKEIRFFGISIHGVFPKRQKALAHKVGELVSTELFSGDDITGAMKSNARSKETFAAIADKIEKVLVERLPELVPMASMFLHPDLVTAIKEMFLEELNGVIDGIIEKLAGNVADTIDVHEVVEEKIANFSVEKMEQLIVGIMQREFQFIEAIGAVLGFLIGFVQLFIVTLQ